MIKKLIKLNNVKSKKDDFLTLDDKTGEFIFKNKSDITKNDKELCGKILDRLAQEGVHPGIQNLIKYKLGRYENYNGGRGLVTEEDIRDLNSHLISMVKKIETRSYIYEIAKKAKDKANYNTLMGMGVDPDYYFDPSSSYYLEIIKDLEKNNIDLVSEGKKIRYVLSYILKDQENIILASIDSRIKNDPVKFLRKLKELKASNQYNNYVLDKLIAQAEVWKVMQKNPKLKDFPFEEIWRFCIDIEFQQFGPYIFENEPGYIIASLNALRFGLEIKKPTYKDYIEINRKCGENVLDKFECGNPCIATELAHEGEMKMGGSYPVAYYSILDKEGLQDLEERSEISDGPFHYAHTSSNSAVVFLTRRPAWEHVRELKFLFEQHDKKIAEANNIAERLIAHIWFSRELSLQHHMQDGNGRTAQIIFISLMANDPELPMMLLDTNPNLEFNGPVAFIKRILAAMANYNKFCGIDEAFLTFEEVAAMLDFDDPKKCLWSYYHPTQEERQAFIDAHPQAEFEEELKHLNDNVELAPKRVWKTDYYKDRVVKSEPTIAERLYNFIDIIRSNPTIAIGIIFYIILAWYMKS